MSDDLESLENRIADLEGRIEDLESRRSGSVEVEVGDQVTVVVEDANEDDDRDPVTHIDGMATFIKSPPGMDIGFGDTLRVKISDIQSRQMVAVAARRD